MPKKEKKKATKHLENAASKRRNVSGRRTLVVGLFVMIAVAAAWWVWLRPPSPKPNVFVFLLDTVRQDALSCYGEHAGLTPNIDALAVDGVRFDQAISTSGWTLPAVASLMTGTWPTLHGGMGRGDMLMKIREELPTAAEVLRQSKYRTIGFANAAFVSPMIGVDRGFEVFNHKYNYNWDARRADETIDAAIAELRRSHSQSGFYFIHLFDAHLDYDPPEPYANKYTSNRFVPALPLTKEKILLLQTGEDGKQPPRTKDVQYVKSLYEGEISFMDTHIGRFIDELKSLRLYDQATIIITSDHGEEFWEHGSFEHGHTLYNELIQIPLIIKFPSTVKPAKRVIAEQVRLLDVMPTVFDIVGVEKPQSFIGESLVPLVNGEKKQHLSAFSESTLYGALRIALRGPRYKYIEILAKDGGRGKGELYDWRKDPEEKKDLSEDLPDITDGMRKELISIFNSNVTASKRMSRPEVANLQPQRIKELRSLGYIE